MSICAKYECMKRIIIVGASSGIGWSLATQYIADGGWMVGVAARRGDRLEALRHLAPERVSALEIDVTADDAAGRLMELVGQMGGMDVFLLSSGVGHQNLGLDAEIEDCTIATNVKGFTAMIDAAYGYFRDNARPGHIAAITSIAGTRGIGIAASYSASKRYQWSYLTAIEQLAYTQGLDLAITDIRPGFVNTPLLDDGNRYPMQLVSDDVARAIRKAISRRRRVVVINWAYAVLVFFWRLIPRAVWRRMVLSVKRRP